MNATVPLAPRSALTSFASLGSNGILNAPVSIGWNVPQLVQIEDRPGELPSATTFEVWDAIKSVQYSGAPTLRMYPLSICCTSSVPNSQFYHITAAQTINETMMVAIDEALQYANEAGVRIVFPLIDWWRLESHPPFNFSPTTSSYRGGIAEFAAFRGLSKTDFYTNAQLISDFEWFIESILNRQNTLTGVLYKEDPAIFAWETGNELSLYESTPYPPGAWTLRIASFIKSIDSNHLVMDGTNGVSDGVSVWSDLQSSGVLALDSPVDMFTNHYYSCTVKRDTSRLRLK
ncbi:hypothetical protein HDU83_007964 [Entophlyctis luteolus]|nr:hypothetical protein HDU83_007964 [Entophlyctis luteolus]